MAGVDALIGALMDDLIGEMRRALAAELRVRLRARLLQQPTEWLVDELMARVDRTLPVAWPHPDHRVVSSDAPCPRPAADVVGHAAALASTMTSTAASTMASTVASRDTDADRAARQQRIRVMGLDEACLRAFIDRCQRLDRDRLESDDYLVNPPAKGSTVIGSTCRTPKGDALLREAKDLLDALLFGDAEAGVRLRRVQRELLTITVARAKAETLACLLRAATEIDAEGTWRDPARVANDDRAPNTLIEVEYGEVATEIVGHGIAVALRLINDLEINEQVLYARMENVEESSLAGIS